jgi:hypothetical protein
MDGDFFSKDDPARRPLAGGAGLFILLCYSDASIIVVWGDDRSGLRTSLGFRRLICHP